MSGAVQEKVSELDQLAYELEQAKAHESRAKELRIAVEEKLVALVEKKDEGTVSAKGEYYKLSVTFNIDRKVDPAICQALAQEMEQEQYERLFKWKPEVSVSELKHLRDNKEEVFKVASKAITSKSSKPTVKVEEVKK